MKKRLALGSVMAFTTLCALSATAAAQEPAPGTMPGDPAVALTDDRSGPPETARYGIAVRAPRLISIPSWMLNTVTQENQPVTSFGSFGAEVFRRKGGLDIVLGFTYQNITPEDGNWLGKNKDPIKDTDYVQVRDLALLGVDATFVWRTYLSDYFSVHYGAGLGVAFVRGEVLRTSNSTALCNASNAGRYPECRPAWCPATGCTEQMFMEHAGVDGTDDRAGRFKDQDVPGAIPVLQILGGVDFRIPEVKGFEARWQFGFYNALFTGLAFAYVF